MSASSLGVQAGQRVYVAVGGYVSPTASANRDQTRELGNFELTVQELPPTADGMPATRGESFTAGIRRDGLDDFSMPPFPTVTSSLGPVEGAGHLSYGTPWNEFAYVYGAYWIY